jgi:protein TonB
MQTNKILSAPLIDLVFDGRNKEYGAYELRNSYAKRINKALFVTTAIAALAFGGATLANSLKKREAIVNISPDINLSAVPEEKIKEKLPELEKPKPQEVQTKTIQYTAPVIVNKDVIENPPPDIEDMTNAKIDLSTKEGVDYTGIAEPEAPDDNKQILDIPKNKEPEIYTSVEIDAKYTGNWRAFLEKNLNANVPVDNGAAPGTYQVVIQFVVDKEGNMSDIKALTNHGFGMEQEAMRVIKKSTKWEPAIQNGYPVKAYRRQPITFQVLED